MVSTVVAVTFDPMVYSVVEGMQLSVILKASIPSVTPYSVEVVNEDVTAKGTASSHYHIIHTTQFCSLGSSTDCHVTYM